MMVFTEVFISYFFFPILAEENNGKILTLASQKKQCGGVYFWLYGIAYWIADSTKIHSSSITFSWLIFIKWGEGVIIKWFWGWKNGKNGKWQFIWVILYKGIDNTFHLSNHLFITTLLLLFCNIKYIFYFRITRMRQISRQDV